MASAPGPRQVGPYTQQEHIHTKHTTLLYTPQYSVSAPLSPHTYRQHHHPKGRQSTRLQTSGFPVSQEGWYGCTARCKCTAGHHHHNGFTSVHHSPKRDKATTQRMARFRRRQARIEKNRRLCRQFLLEVWLIKVVEAVEAKKMCSKSRHSSCH